MPACDGSGFRWSDAWLLAAVGLAAGPGRAALARVIGAADAVQHAIPTREELDGATGRLGRAGYVERTPEGLSLTDSGRALLERAGRAGRSHLAQQEALEHLLGAAPWVAEYDRRQARDSEPESLTPDEYDAAVRAYYAQVGHRP